MSTDRNRYSSRVEALSNQQLTLLARRLEKANEPSLSKPAQTPSRLLAFLTTAEEPLDPSELRGFIQSALPEYMAPRNFVLLDEMPRTAAGKIDTSALLAMPREAKDSEIVKIVEPRNEVESILAEIWAEVLDMDSVSVQDNFFEVGGDSLLSIRILARARQFGLQISPEQFFSSPTVEEQAKAAGRLSKIQFEPGQIKGSAPLLPIQHWFFDRITVEPQYWNQSLLVSLSQSLEPSDLERAIQQLLLHHDSLRSHFSYQDGSPSKQSFGELAIELPVLTFDLSATDNTDPQQAIAALADGLYRNFDLAEGPLLRCALIRSGNNRPDRLLLVIHHLIVDGESWRILLEDLDRLIAQIQRGETIRLPAKTNSLKNWATRIEKHAESETIVGQIDYWKKIDQSNVFRLPVDFDASADSNRVEFAETITQELDIQHSGRLLRDLPQHSGTRINDALLTALYNTLSQWLGKPCIGFDLEGHGREALFEDLDLSRTVGWFTTVFPVVLSRKTQLEAEHQLYHTKEQLRSIPGNGIGHGLLKYLSSNKKIRQDFSQYPNAQLCFNYLGRIEQRYDSFTIEQSNCGRARSPAGLRAYLIDVNAQFIDEQLSIAWTFSRSFHHRKTIENLAAVYIKAITDLIQCVDQTRSPERSSSDFPLADLDDGEFNHLSQLLDRIDDEK